MKCERVKELLMSDFIDGEVGKSLKMEIEGHLETCANCKKVEEQIRKIAVKPFEVLEKTSPPEEVWQRIKGAIEEKREVEVAPGLLERFRLLLARQYAYVVPAVSFVVLIMLFQ